MHCVDLGESFPTSYSNEYLLAKFGFNTAENKPSTICQDSAIIILTSLVIWLGKLPGNLLNRTHGLGSGRASLATLALERNLGAHHQWLRLLPRGVSSAGAEEEDHEEGRRTASCAGLFFIEDGSATVGRPFVTPSAAGHRKCKKST